MKRTTLMAVLVTTGALIAAGSLPRLHWGGGLSALSALASGARAASQSWPVRIRRDLRASGWSLERRSLATPRGAAATATAIPTPVPAAPGPAASATPAGNAAPRAAALPRGGLLLYAALGAIAGLALLALLARLSALLRRDPRAQVFSLARRGRSAADIARSVHVPQDAVRTLLTPGLGARRSR